MQTFASVCVKTHGAYYNKILDGFFSILKNGTLLLFLLFLTEPKLFPGLKWSLEVVQKLCGQDFGLI